MAISEHDLDLVPATTAGLAVAPAADPGTGAEPAAPGRSRSVAGNAGFLMASQLLTFGLGAIVMVVMPRTLGPEALGQLRLAQSLWAMAAIVLSFGTPTLISKEVARDPAVASAIVGPTLLVQALLFVGLSLGMAAYVAIAGHGATFAAVLALIGVGTLFGEMATTGRSTLFGLERMDLTSVADIGGKVLYVAAVLLALGLGFDVVGAAAATTVYGIVLAAAFIGVLARTHHVALQARLRDLPPILRQGRPYLLMGAIMVVYQQVDVVVISLLVDDETIGWYATSDALLGSLLFLPVIFSTAVFPHVARLHQERPEDVPTVLRKSLAYVFLLAAPIGLGVLAVAQPLVVQLFGSEFERSGPVLAVLGIALILMHLTIVLGRFAMAIDRQGLWIRLMVVATALSIALDVVLVPFTDRRYGNGAIGGAVAYVVTEGLLLVVGVRTLAPGVLDAELVRKVGKALAAGLAMVAAVWPLRDHFVAVPVLAGGAVYVAGIVATRWFTGPDLAEVGGVLPGPLRRLARRTPGTGGGS